MASWPLPALFDQRPSSVYHTQRLTMCTMQWTWRSMLCGFICSSCYWLCSNSKLLRFVVDLMYNLLYNKFTTRGKVLSWEYRSPRKRNSRPPAPVILCWVSWVENVLLIYYASSDLLVSLHWKLVCLHWKKSPVYGIFGQYPPHPASDRNRKRTWACFSP